MLACFFGKICYLRAFRPPGVSSGKRCGHPTLSLAVNHSAHSCSLTLRRDEGLGGVELGRLHAGAGALACEAGAQAHERQLQGAGERRIIMPRVRRAFAGTLRAPSPQHSHAPRAPAVGGRDCVRYADENRSSRETSALSRALAPVFDAVDMRAVGRRIVEDCAARPQQAIVAVQPYRPRALLLPRDVEVAGAPGDGVIAQPVAFRVPQEAAYPVARRGVRPVLAPGAPGTMDKGGTPPPSAPDLQRAATEREARPARRSRVEYWRRGLVKAR